MSKKSTTSKKEQAAEPTPQRVALDKDPTVRAFQFINGWARNGEAMLDRRGNQIRSASELFAGGGALEDDSAGKLMADLASGIVTAFVNPRVIVYRTNPNPRPRRGQSQLKALA